MRTVILFALIAGGATWGLLAVGGFTERVITAIQCNTLGKVTLLGVTYKCTPL